MGNRSTNAELDGLRERIVRIAFETNPLSVRNLFYQLTADDGSGVTVEKTEAAYKRVVRQKGQLCHGRSIPWNYFSDSSRVAYDNDGYEGLGDTGLPRPCTKHVQAELLEHASILSYG